MSVNYSAVAGLGYKIDIEKYMLDNGVAANEAFDKLEPVFEETDFNLIRVSDSWCDEFDDVYVTIRDDCPITEIESELMELSEFLIYFLDIPLVGIEDMTGNLSDFLIFGVNIA